jgi:hypothetical protein
MSINKKKKTTNKTKTKNKIYNKKTTKINNNKSLSHNLLKSKLSTSSQKSQTLDKQQKQHKKKRNLIDKQCSIYKTDLNGKNTFYLFSTCKTNKYCRKYKCKDIDNKIQKTLTRKLGLTHKNILLDNIRLNCSPNLSNQALKKCENKTISNFYKEHKMEPLYNKLLECDKTTCFKEKQAFNNELYRQRQLKLKKNQKDLLATEELGADTELIIKN